MMLVVISPSIPTKGCYTKHNECIYIYIIIITIFNMISTTCAMYCVYSNISRPAFLERCFPMLSALCSFLNLIKFLCVILRKHLMWGSWSPEPLTNFNTYFWLEECLMFLCQKKFISSLSSPINLMFEQGILSVKSNKYVFLPLKTLELVNIT